MFLWLKVHFENHPLFSTYKKSGELERLARALWIFWTTKPYLVLASPGAMFASSDVIRKEESYPYFRLCFAACDEEQVGPISQRLADALPVFFRIKDRKVIDKMLEEDEAAIAMRCQSAELAQMIGPC